MLISFLYIIFGAFSLWTYYFMYGYNLNFFNVLVLYCLIQFVGMIPISVNGWGLREGTMAYSFSLLGVPSEISLSIGILSRIAMFVITSLGGVLYLVEKKK